MMTPVAPACINVSPPAAKRQRNQAPGRASQRRAPPGETDLLKTTTLKGLGWPTATSMTYGYLRLRAPKRRDTPLAHVTDLAKSFRILSPQTHFRSFNDAICAHKRRPRRTCRGPHFLQPTRATPTERRTTMLTLDQPQHQTLDGVAPSPRHRVAPTPLTRIAPPPAHPSIPPPRAPDPPTPPTPSPHTHDALPRQTRMEITSALLDPESDPCDIAQNLNLPLDTILDIFESEEFQHRLQRIERMQARRAEFHLNTAKPLAARNLALILEAARAEEFTRTNRDTPEATTLRCRARETTRKVCNNILSPKSTIPCSTDMSPCRRPPPSESREAAKAFISGEAPGKSRPGAQALESDRDIPKRERGQRNVAPQTNQHPSNRAPPQRPPNQHTRRIDSPSAQSTHQVN